MYGIPKNICDLKDEIREFQTEEDYLGRLSDEIQNMEMSTREWNTFKSIF